MDRHSSVEYLPSLMWLLPLFCFFHVVDSTNHYGQFIPEIPNRSPQESENLTESLAGIPTLSDGLSGSTNLVESLSKIQLNPDENLTENINDSGNMEEKSQSESIKSSSNIEGMSQTENLLSSSNIEDGSRTGSIKSTLNNSSPIDFLHSNSVFGNEGEISESDVIWSDPIVEEIPENTLLFPNRRRDAPDTEVPERGFPDETKDMILKLHNLYRGNVTPPAGNMGLLEWDTDLEHLAQLWADGCDFKHGKPPNTSYKPGPYGQNLYIGTDPSGYKGLWLWYYEHNYYDSETQVCEPNQQCGHYVTMAWAESSKIGCGVTKCGLRYLIVCHYFPAPLKGQKMYTVGRPCSQCPSENGSLCLENLCVTWDQCDRNSKLCDEAECNLRCRNCGRLDREKCRCECADGWDSPDCSRLCTDEHERCGVTPGFPSSKSCSLNKYSVAKKYCRRMCESCNTYGNDTESDNVCCDGKFCEVGHILETKSCTCKMLCPGLTCNYMDEESRGELLKCNIVTAVLLFTVTQLILHAQSVIIK